jgi:hypothetical protein
LVAVFIRQSIELLSVKKWISAESPTVTSITPRQMYPAGPGRFGSTAAFKPVKGILEE